MGWIINNFLNLMNNSFLIFWFERPVFFVSCDFHGNFYLFLNC